MTAQNNWTRFAGGVSVVTDAAIMDALFLSFSYIESDSFQSPGLPLWALCALLCYTVNLFFLRKPRPIPALAGLNVALLAGTLFVVFRFSATLTGWVATAFTVLFLLISVARTFQFAWSPVTLSAQLIHADLLFLALVWLALSAQPLLADRPDYLALQLAVLLLNLACAVALRVGGGTEGSVLVGAPVAGGLLSVGLLAGLMVVLLILVRTLAGHSRTAVDTIAAGITSGAAALWDAINRFFTWLFSLLPKPDLAQSALPEATLPSMDESGALEEAVLDPTILYIAGAVVLVLAVIGAVLLLIRFRHSKLTLGKVGGVSAPPVRRKKLRGALGRRLEALMAELRFRVLAFRKRDTPAGVLVWLEGRMKKAGAPRLPGETPRAFLLRLPLDLSSLADLLDAQYYGSKGEGYLSPAQCRDLRRQAAKVLPTRPVRQPSAPPDGPDEDCGHTGPDRSSPSPDSAHKK